MNLFCIFRTTKFKWISIFQPVIWNFYLISVFDLLFEHTITITDTTSICTVIQCCKRIQEACSQTSKTTISKCRIRFLILDHVKIQTKFIQSFFYLFVCCQVDQVISKSTSHEELHGHIVNCLRILLFICILCFQPVINDNIFYSVAYSLENLFLCSFFEFFTIKKFNVFLYALFESFFFKLLVNHCVSSLITQQCCAFLFPQFLQIMPGIFTGHELLTFLQHQEQLALC